MMTQGAVLDNAISPTAVHGSRYTEQMMALLNK
jgi:hypothetical protein